MRSNNKADPHKCMTFALIYDDSPLYGVGVTVTIVMFEDPLTLELANEIKTDWQIRMTKRLEKDSCETCRKRLLSSVIRKHYKGRFYFQGVIDSAEVEM